jgi:hypothetical protein
LPIGSGAQAFSILEREGAIHAFASLESADSIAPEARMRTIAFIPIAQFRLNKAPTLERTRITSFVEKALAQRASPDRHSSG